MSALCNAGQTQTSRLHCVSSLCLKVFQLDLAIRKYLLFYPDHYGGFALLSLCTYSLPAISFFLCLSFFLHNVCNKLLYRLKAMAVCSNVNGNLSCAGSGCFRSGETCLLLHLYCECCLTFNAVP